MRKNKLNLLLILLLAFVGLTSIESNDFEFTWQDENTLNSDVRISPTDPPTGQVRAIAEFEPMDAVIVRYPLGIPTEFVALLSQESPVICIVASSYEQSSAQSSFDAAGVNNDNLSYIIADTDSYWTRDYTSWFITNGDQEVSVLNFEYNRPRPNDNLFPGEFADEFDYPYYAMNIEQTGGNFMCDGYGIAASSHIAYTENSNNQTLVNSTMESYMGITDYMVIQDPNETYIDHIDCWGKFLSVDKVLIRQVATSHSQYDELEEVADMFATTNCSWGYPYEVVRVYTPNDEPYSNSLILNDRVFVPQTGGQWDDEALETYEQAMPGYTVYGVVNNTWNEWESTDALHCRTHEIPGQDMLSILHYPIWEDVQDQAITIEARIIAHSNENIYADSTKVFYRTSPSQDWQSANMTLQNEDTYSVEIGPFDQDCSIEYFIHSADESGQSEDYPYVGQEDPFTFNYHNSSSNVAPVITFDPVLEVETADLPLTITCQAIDQDDNLAEVKLFAVVNGNARMITMQEDLSQDDTFFCDWDFSEYLNETDNFVTYRINATDLAGASTQTENFTLNVEVTPNANNETELVTGILNTYPNPFHNNVSIQFSSKSNNQTISVYNIKGQLVRTIKSTAKANSLSSVNWDGRDSNGNKSASGIYYIIMENGRTKSTKKVLLMK